MQYSGGKTSLRGILTLIVVPGAWLAILWAPWGVRVLKETVSHSSFPGCAARQTPWQPLASTRHQAHSFWKLLGHKTSSSGSFQDLGWVPSGSFSFARPGSPSAAVLSFPHWEQQIPQGLGQHFFTATLKPFFLALLFQPDLFTVSCTHLSVYLS